MGATETTIDQQETLRVLQGLIQINSVNPSLVEGAARERRHSRFLDCPERRTNVK
jgi:hypothetical protein